MIPALIDRPDNIEVVRDKIALILATEIASQQALATAAGKDPDDWKLRIFTERSNPWEQFSNQDDDDRSPLVNVWIDSATYDRSASNVMERQKTDAVFNIDCYGYAVSSQDAAGGHKPGDREAAFEVQKALRLVRSVMMAAEYTYLGLRGLVWGRWPQSVTVFQPELDGQTVQQIVGARLALRAEFNEFSPQVAESTLDFLSVDVVRSEDGQILVEADFDYT